MATNGLQAYNMVDEYLHLYYEEGFVWNLLSMCKTK